MPNKNPRGPLDPIFDNEKKVGSIDVGNSPGIVPVDPYTTEFFDDFNRPDAGDLGGPWDGTGLNSFWALLSLGTGGFSIANNQLGMSQVNTITAWEVAVASSRKMWGSLENHASLTSGLSRQARILINLGNPGGTYGSYYWGSFGWSGTASYVAIGKWWNGADNTLATANVSVPVGATVRIRHDGVGGLTLSVDGLDVLTYQDEIWLRALGGGIGHVRQNSGEGMVVDNANFGTWGLPIVYPTPWYEADVVDTDTFSASPAADGGGVLWTREPTVNSLGIGLNGTYGGYITTPDNNFLKLTDDSALEADQFCQFSLDDVSQVKPRAIILRSSSTTTGYYFSWRRLSQFTAFWDIGILGGAILVSSANTGGGTQAVTQMRFEAEGTALRAYLNGSLLLSTTDSSIPGPATVRINLNGLGGQGVPLIHDIMIGNL